MPRHSQRRLPVLLFVPPQPITQHSSSHDATPLTPIVRAVCIGVFCFFVRQSVVVLTAGLMCEMLQTIPLRAGLCVDVNLVIHGLPIGKVRKVDLFLVKLLPAKARELHVVQRPVELDVFAGADLFGGSLDDRGGEKVDG